MPAQEVLNVSANNPGESLISVGMKADQSDAADRLRRGGGVAQPAGAAGMPAGLPLLFALVLVLAGVVFYLLYQESAAQKATTQRLEAMLDTMRADLAQLSGEVNQTGASLSETGSQTGQKLRFLESEIRKLWVVSNERNKAEIQAHSEELKKLSGAQKASDKQLSTALNSVRKFEEELAAASKSGAAASKQATALQEEFNTLRQALKKDRSAAEERQLTLQTRIDQVAAQARTLNEKLRTLEEATARLDSAAATIETNRQAIRSIDAFRKQTNQAVTSLQSAVNDLQKDLEEMKRVY